MIITIMIMTIMTMMITTMTMMTMIMMNVHAPVEDGGNALPLADPGVLERLLRADPLGRIHRQHLIYQIFRLQKQFGAHLGGSELGFLGRECVANCLL